MNEREMIALLDDVETFLDTTQGPVCKKPCDHESCELLERIRKVTGGSQPMTNHPPESERAK